MFRTGSARRAGLEVRNAGVGFVIARATYSNTGLDEQYERNRTGSAQQGHSVLCLPPCRAGRVDRRRGRRSGSLCRCRPIGWSQPSACARPEDPRRLDFRRAPGVGQGLARPRRRAPRREADDLRADCPLGRLDGQLRPGSPTTAIGSGCATGTASMPRFFPPTTGTATAGRLWQTGTAQVPGIKGWVDQDLFNGLSLAPIRIKNNR